METKPDASKDVKATYFRPWVSVVIVIVLVGLFAGFRTRSEQSQAGDARLGYDIMIATERVRVHYWTQWKATNPAGTVSQFLNEVKNRRIGEKNDPFIIQYFDLINTASSQKKESFTQTWGYVPSEGPAQIGLLTNIFIHSDPVSLFLLLIFVWITAATLEAVWGPLYTAGAFLVGGWVMAIVAGVFVSPSDKVLMGPYGSVFILGGALPLARPWINWGSTLKIPSALVVILWFGLQLMSGAWGGALNTTGGLITGIIGIAVGAGGAIGISKVLPKPAAGAASTKGAAQARGAKRAVTAPIAIDREAIARAQVEIGKSKEAGDKEKSQIREMIEAGSIEEANEKLKELLSALPEDLELHELQIKVLQKLDRKEEALQTILRLIGLLLRRTGDFPAEGKAIKLYQGLGIPDALPDNVNDAFLLLKALAKVEMYTETVLAGNALVRRWSTDELAPKVLSFLAKIHSDKIEDKESAIRVLKILVARYAGTKDAEFAKGELERLGAIEET